MFAKAALISVLAALSAVSPVSAHGVLVNIKGSNGVSGKGFGVDLTTPRNGSRPFPYQRDASLISDLEIASGRVGPCGRTRQLGVINTVAEMTAASAAGLPAASPDGTVTMSLHQVNGDGAGPYHCDVSADGTGKKFVAMQTITDVPNGKNSRTTNVRTTFPLVARLPGGTKCTGGPNKNACLIRCRNIAVLGPFGGCAAVTNAATNAGANSRPSTSATIKCARSDDTLEEDDDVPSEDLYKRAVKIVKSFEKKRVLKTRIVGAAKAGEWI